MDKDTNEFVNRTKVPFAVRWAGVLGKLTDPSVFTVLGNVEVLNVLIWI